MKKHKNDNMNSNRKKTITAGSLYIFGLIAGILSIAPAIDSPDYLLKASANANQVLSGGLWQLIMTVAYAGFAITLYPTLRKYKESLALGFLSFRIIATVLNIIGFIILLLILSLSQEFAETGAQNLAYFHTLGDLLRSGRDFVNHIAMILVLSFGNLMFYLLLYQTILIPRWLSLLGFLGTLLTMSASLLVMFQIIEIITTIYMVFNLPLILIELILAIWFITKGFDSNRINTINEQNNNDKVKNEN